MPLESDVLVEPHSPLRLRFGDGNSRIELELEPLQIHKRSQTSIDAGGSHNRYSIAIPTELVKSRTDERKEDEKIEPFKKRLVKEPCAQEIPRKPLPT
jgi:hypothetical protein